MIPVSSENPYVGSNLFLAKEMERSGYLYNFFKANGAPQAIELTGSDESDLEARFFYAKHREMYLARPHVDEATATKEWIIRGPYAVDRPYFKQVGRLPADDRAVFEVWGRKEYFGQSAEAAVSHAIAPAFVPTPTPKPTPRSRPKTKVITATPVPTQPPAPINFDQKALLEAKELADRAPNGDLVHIVKEQTETLQSIATWYTGSGENAEKLAEKNGLSGDAQLRPGNRVLVPAELVKNPKTMK
jgi:hypothetical protein